MVRAAKLRSTSLELWAVYVIWNLTKQITLTHHPSPCSSFMARSLLRARTLCVMSVPLCAMSWRLSHAEGVLAIEFESIRESAGGAHSYLGLFQGNLFTWIRFARAETESCLYDSLSDFTIVNSRCHISPLVSLTQPDWSVASEIANHRPIYCVSSLFIINVDSIV